MAAFLKYAGADFLWANEPSTGSLPLDFEAVFDRAADADFWLNMSTWSSVDEVLAADERYANFAALKGGNAYNRNARVNEHGGNDFWESGLANPHKALADLIAIFHPELLPDHQLIWYRKLDPQRGRD